MRRLSDISDEFSYIVRDYPSIIKWFVNKSKYITNKWTDFSVSEPDTLSLSYIAYIFDLLNYLIDQKFLETVFSETSSVKFLSELYQLVGSELLDYESGVITTSVDNKSDDSTLVINKLDILRLKDHSNELFTSTEHCEVRPRLSRSLNVVRGTPIYFKVSKIDMNNGYFVLPDRNINRNFVEVTIDDTPLDLVDDALFEPGLECFSISQKGDYKTMVRLSPKAYRKVKNEVIVKYVLNDPYPLASGSELVLLKSVDSEYSITSDKSLELSDISIDEMKYNYFKVLKEVFTLINKNYDVSNLIGGRVDYLRLGYDMKPLLSEGVIDHKSGEVKFNFNRVPTEPVSISYQYFDGEIFIDNEVVHQADSIESSVDLELSSSNDSFIKKLSVVIKCEDNTIIDSGSKLVTISCPSKVELDYSTSDNQPLENILNSGSIDYSNGSVVINFSYIPDRPSTVKYISDNGVEFNFELPLSRLENSLILEIPRGDGIKPGTFSITIGNNVIVDDGEGSLTSKSTDESVFKDKVSDNLLINKSRDDIILNKLVIRKINIDATVYLYPSDTSIDEIDKDIKSELRRIYAKGSHNPGEPVQRVALNLSIENSNSNIKYVELNYPMSDIVLGDNQISDIGRVTLQYKRG